MFACVCVCACACFQCTVVRLTVFAGIASTTQSNTATDAAPNLFLDLDVPGLIERRPAVVYADMIRLRFSAFGESVLPYEYAGFVHSVRGSVVTLCVPQAVGSILTTEAATYFESLCYQLQQSGRLGALQSLCHSFHGPPRDTRWREPLWLHVRFSSQKHKTAFSVMLTAVDTVERTPLLPLLFPGDGSTAAAEQDQYVKPANISDQPTADAPPHSPPPPDARTAPGAFEEEREGEEEEMQKELGEVDADGVFACAGVSLNHEQKDAVRRMVCPRTSRREALLVFGPPGTGKTLTLVEGILSLVSRRGPRCRILCCAPSDSAADVIVQRLTSRAESFGPSPSMFTPWHESLAQNGARQEARQGLKWVVRLNSPLREMQAVRPDVVPYSVELDAETQRFGVPELDELLTAPIIVTTCASSILLQERGVPPGHFDMIVVDEAAQALEPETLVPLTLKGEGTLVVLAGDWKQLGPVVRSRAADALGLGISLLQRLASRPFYEREACPLLVKLRRNYRSHEELLQLPSKLFYQQALIAAADPSSTNDLLGAAARITAAQAAASGERVEEGGDDAKVGRAAAGGDEEQMDAGMGVDAVALAEGVLLGADEDDDGVEGGEEGQEEEEEEEGVSVSTPLLFYGVEGRDMSDGDSLSFFNPLEALQVLSPSHSGKNFKFPIFLFFILFFF